MNFINTKLIALQIIPSDNEWIIISECASQLDMSREEMEALLNALATVINDTSFTAQVLAINARINTLAEDN